MPDVSIQNEGSIVLLRPLSDIATSWFKAYVPEDSMWFGGALVVEPRYVQGLLDGMLADGLQIK